MRRALRFPWRSWRLGERQYTHRGHDRERRSEAGRRCRLSSPQAFSAPACWNRYTKRSWGANLQKRGLSVARQQVIPVVYEGTRFEMGFRADLVVQDSVIVEIKSIAEITALHKKQLLTYLRLADKRLGLLINFNVALIKDGITRIVNGLEE